MWPFRKKSATGSADTLDEAELKLFVSKTLKAIIGGIADADRFTRPIDAGVIVNQEGRIPLQHQVRFDLPEDVSFDVAVTVTRNSGKRGGLKLEVLSVGANIGSESGRGHSLASRVSFKVPMSWNNK